MIENTIVDHEDAWPARTVTGHHDTPADGIFSVFADASGRNAAVFVDDALGLPLGMVTALDEQVAKDVQNGDMDIAEGVNWFHCSGRDGGETQYGSGYGDVYEIAGYWMIQPLTVTEARERVPALLGAEAERWTSGKAFADPLGPLEATS